METPASADFVVCGAGVAGLSTAWQLAVRRRAGRVLIVDPRPPLTLTSDKSTECYRNWWPDRPMVALMNRSIEILDDLAASTGNAFALNRNGYLFATGTPEGAEALESQARAASALGAGPVRIHRGRSGDPPYREPRWDRPEATAEGADLFLDPAEIHRRFPGLAPDLTAALHARRCGWLSAQQLGMVWLEQAREAGAELLAGEVVAVDVEGRRVTGVHVAPPGGGATTRIACPVFVDAAGPFAADVARMAGAELPLFHELHCKVFFDDEHRRIARELPLVCWNDPVTVAWSTEERTGLADDPSTRKLLDELPAGVHFRPEGGRDSRSLILLWNYDVAPCAPGFPIAIDPLHLQVVLRGVARVAPAFAVYLERGRRPYVDGGYYTKTRENRPLIGPLNGERAAGFHLVAALSGFGIMASPAAGELAAAQILGETPPDWHRAFLLSRYSDPDYVAAHATAASGQL
jgi:glycine/D-amino acid oxidase-like deaminating enzyme